MKKAIEHLNNFKEKQMEKKSENTVKAYISDIQQFNSFIQKNNREFDDIGNKDIEDFITHLLGTKNKLTGHLLKPQTVNRKLVSIRKFIEYLNASDEYKGKLFIEIELLKVQEQYYLDNLLTKQEYDRMVERTLLDEDLNAYLIFNTLYYTGVRVSELLQMKAEHISNDSLTVRGKGKKYREIILSEAIIKILKEHINRNNIGPEEKIFNMTRQNVHATIKKHAGRCRIKLAHAHAHNFRHLCAFRLIDNGASIEEVADFLGHSNINTTRIYTRKTKTQLKETLNKL